MERLLRRVVDLGGAGHPFLRDWLNTPAAPFRDLLLPVVPAPLLRTLASRPDDPLAPRAWLAWLRKEGGRKPGQTLKESVPEEDLRRSWETALREPGFPDRTPPELLATSRRPA